jgi:hypothetical protein
MKLKFAQDGQLGSRLSFLDRFLTGALRLQPILLLFSICCVLTLVGVFVVRDLRNANTEAKNIFTSSIQGLQSIGDLQYDTQETRRATLYALTTNDSNLQIIYADQSRSADQRVKDGIAEYGKQAKRPSEVALAGRLKRDWNRCLTCIFFEADLYSLLHVSPVSCRCLGDSERPDARDHAACQPADGVRCLGLT